MDEYLHFTEQFQRVSNINLQAYKRPQMERRLTFLRDKLGFSDFPTFLLAMRENPAVLHQLLDRMTINVSEFFRNPPRWDTLLTHLPGTGNGVFRAWSAACSTGEEPYTLAMLLHHHRPGLVFDILATDLDTHVLEFAAAGTYRDAQVKSIPDSYLSDYFDRQNQKWVVRSELRQQIRFERHDLIAQPYPDALDLIVCRNVLIYFTDAAKDQVVRGLVGALRAGGLLFVGNTEQFLHTHGAGLELVAPFLYRKGTVEGSR